MIIENRKMKREREREREREIERERNIGVMSSILLISLPFSSSLVDT